MASTRRRKAHEPWVCPRCSESDETKRVKNGAWCRACHAEDGRNRRLKTLFNLTVEEYELILTHQAGGCAICGRKPKPGGNRLAVDHDHKTGLVRGLLCWDCNVALGKFRDDADRVRKAAEYITTPPAVRALQREVFGVKGRVTKYRKTRKRRVASRRKGK